MIPLPGDKNNLPETIGPDGSLTDNEAGFIMDNTLKPVHRRNEKIVSFIDCFVRTKSIDQSSAECGVARSIGYKWRHRKDIANCIQKLSDKSAIKYGFDKSEIFERVKEVVEFDPIMIQNPDGSFKDNMHDIPPEARRCIKKLKVKNLYNQDEDINGIKKQIIIGKLIEYEFYDKLKGAELTGREKEMFKNTTKVEHDVTKDMASVLLASSKRADDRNKELPIIDVTPTEVE